MVILSFGGREGMTLGKGSPSRHWGYVVDNKEVRAGFASIVQKWTDELHEWDDARLTKHPFVVNHGGYDHPGKAVPTEPAVPDPG